MAHNVTGANIQDIYDRINDVDESHPLDANTFSDWSMQAGDMVTVKRGGEEYKSPVHNSKLVWRGTPQMTISSTGNKERDAVSKVSRKKYGRGGAAVRANEGIHSYVWNATSTIYSFIDQTATSLTSHVEDIANDIGTEILQTASQIRAEVHAANSTLYSYVDATATSITSHVEDVANDIGTEILQTASEIRAEVHAANSTLYSYVDATATSITSHVEDVANDIGTEILQTASEIRAEVHAANSTLYSYVDATATSITSHVEDVANDIGTEILQTSSQIYSAVYANSSTIYTYIDQTASGIRQDVASTESGLRASIKQQADRISLVVEGTGNNAYIKPAMIQAGIEHDTGSVIKLSADNILIDGSTAISNWLSVSSGNLKVDGTLIADDINISGTNGVIHSRYYEVYSGGEISFAGGQGANAIVLSTSVLGSMIKSATKNDQTGLVTLTPFVGEPITFRHAASGGDYVTGYWSGNALQVSATPTGDSSYNVSFQTRFNEYPVDGTNVKCMEVAKTISGTTTSVEDSQKYCKIGFSNAGTAGDPYERLTYASMQFAIGASAGTQIPGSPIASLALYWDAANSAGYDSAHVLGYWSGNTFHYDKTKSGSQDSGTVSVGSGFGSNSGGYYITAKTGNDEVDNTKIYYILGESNGNVQIQTASTPHTKISGTPEYTIPNPTVGSISVGSFSAPYTYTASVTVNGASHSNTVNVPEAFANGWTSAFANNNVELVGSPASPTYGDTYTVTAKAYTSNSAQAKSNISGASISITIPADRYSTGQSDMGYSATWGTGSGANVLTVSKQNGGTKTNSTFTVTAGNPTFNYNPSTHKYSLTGTALVNNSQKASAVSSTGTEAYDAGWDAAYGKMSIPLSASYESNITIKYPSNTHYNQDTAQYDLSVDNSYAYIKLHSNANTVARVSNTAYGAGWDAAYGKMSIPVSAAYGSSITIKFPSNTHYNQDTAQYDLSVDNSYAYIKLHSNANTVARVSNTAYGAGWDAAYGKMSIPIHTSYGSSMSFSFPSNTHYDQDTAVYSLSVDKDYAYITLNANDNVVARVANSSGLGIYDANGNKISSRSITSAITVYPEVWINGVEVWDTAVTFTPTHTAPWANQIGSGAEQRSCTITADGKSSTFSLVKTTVAYSGANIPCVELRDASSRVIARYYL